MDKGSIRERSRGAWTREDQRASSERSQSIREEASGDAILTKLHNNAKGGGVGPGAGRLVQRPGDPLKRKVRDRTLDGRGEVKPINRG